MKFIQAIAGVRFSAALKYFVVVFPSIFAIAGPALANLGNGYEQVDDTYGNLIQRRLRDNGAVTVVYHKGRYLYEVTFANGRSVAESYFHVKGTDLSQNEITRFLKANAAGGTWTAVDPATKQHFKRSDGRAEAKYGEVNGRRGLTVREVAGGF